MIYIPNLKYITMLIKSMQKLRDQHLKTYTVTFYSNEVNLISLSLTIGENCKLTFLTFGFFSKGYNIKDDSTHC